MPVGMKYYLFTIQLVDAYASLLTNAQVGDEVPYMVLRIDTTPFGLVSVKKVQKGDNETNLLFVADGSDAELFLDSENSALIYEYETQDPTPPTKEFEIIAVPEFTLPVTSV